MWQVGVALFQSSERLPVPCTDEGLSGGTKAWQVAAQCAADSNGLHPPTCLTSQSECFQIYDKHTYIHTVCMDRNTCVNTYKHSHTSQPVQHLRPQAYRLWDGLYSCQIIVCHWALYICLTINHPVQQHPSHGASTISMYFVMRPRTLRLSGDHFCR